MTGPEVTVTSYSKGLSTHTWEKWEKDVSVRGSHAGTGAQAGCSLSDPGDLQHFTGQGPRQRWDRYVALKLALV